MTWEQRGGQQQGGYPQQGGDPPQAGYSQQPAGPYQQPTHPYQQPTGPYQQAPGPYQQAPYQQLPPQKAPRKALRVVMIVGGVVVALVLAVGVIAYRDYQSKFGVVDPPNADHITAYPDGQAPWAIDDMAQGSGLFTDADTIDYAALDGASIQFVEKPREYWDDMAVGTANWEPRGDLLKDMWIDDQYLLAFTDATLLIQADGISEAEIVAATERFLAVKRGETFEQDWGAVEPPNLADLPALADKSGAVPTWDNEPTMSQGDGMSLWTAEYDLMRSVTAYDRQLWQYFTASGGLVANGPVLCQSLDTMAICVLAGSDAIVAAAGYPDDEAQLVAILTGLI